MDIQLLHSTPLWLCARAIRKCWESEDKSDTIITYAVTHGGECDLPVDEIVCGDKDKQLIDRVGNKNKHSSTLEHLVYTFDIDGISRACLQEVARHRIASYSVKSTRYTLNRLKESPVINEHNYSDFCVSSGYYIVDCTVMDALRSLQRILKSGLSNDIAKYCLPEAFKTSLVMTINARSLQNFLSLRSDKSALWEIQKLARGLYGKLPEGHKYLFKDYIKGMEDKL